jgi:hypothetical protein
MHARHGEVEGEEQLDGLTVRTLQLKCGTRHEMLLELVGVLQDLDPQEHQSQAYGQEQKHHLAAAMAPLRTPHGERHGQAAAQQDRGVDRPKRKVEVAASLGKGGGVTEDIHEEAGEETPEEHDLRDEEGPHPEGGDLVLLLQADEVMLQRRFDGLSHLRPPWTHRRTLPG